MTRRSRVVIIQETLPHYRVAFFERLRERLTSKSSTGSRPGTGPLGAIKGNFPGRRASATFAWVRTAVRPWYCSRSVPSCGVRIWSSLNRPAVYWSTTGFS